MRCWKRSTEYPALRAAAALIVSVAMLLGAPAASAQTCGICGDVNGDGEVNIVDALFVAQQTVGLRTSLPCPALSDVKEDSDVNIVDALFMAQFTVGSRPILCFRIGSPEALALFANSSAMVTGLLTGDASVACNSMAATQQDGTFQVEVPLRAADNVINCLATQPDGMVASANVSVTLDNVAPVAVIDSPRDGLVTAADHVDVTGVVNDILSGYNAGPPVVTVGGVIASVSGRSFVAAGVPLRPGPNTLTAITTDSANNMSTSSPVMVTRQDVAGQHIQLISGNNQSGVVGTALPNSLVAQILDSQGNGVSGRPVVFAVTRGSGTLAGATGNGQMLTVMSDANGRASAQFTLGINVGEGSHRVTATAMGFVGEAAFCASATASPADHIVIISGNNQTGAVGEMLSRPLIVSVVDVTGNPIADVPVTFTVLDGQGSLSGGVPTLAVATGPDGKAATTLRLGPLAGLSNNRVQADFVGLAGLPASFIESAVEPGLAADTSISGIVIDNSDIPVPGVTALIPNTTFSAIADDQGRFRITGAPVGPVVLFIYGASSPREGVWPNLEFNLVTIAGQDNTIGGPIRLPALDPNSAKIVGGDTTETLTLADVPGSSLTVFPHSVTFADGSHVGLVSVTQVHFDKVPMPPPNGSQFSIAWTIQPPGVRFNPPARMTIPNNGMPPGTQIEMFSFDHDLGQFVSIGSASVSADGSIVQSDPGFGVVKGGWHGCTPPPPPRTCTISCKSPNPCIDGQVLNPPCVCKFTNKPTGSTCGGGIGRDSSCKQNGVCVPVNGTPMCVGGDRTSGDCNDGKICTEPDMCNSQGKCEGTKIADGTPSELSLSLAFINTILKGVSDWIGLLQLGNFTLPSVSGSIKRTTQKICCEQTQDKNSNKTTWGGELKFNTPLDTGDLVLNVPPWSGQFQKSIFGTTVGIAYGITVRARVNFSFQLNGKKDMCTMRTCFSGQSLLQGQLNAGLIGAVSNPGVVNKCGPTKMDGCSLIKVTGTAESGLGLGVMADCMQETLGLTWPGLKIPIELTALEGTTFQFMYADKFQVVNGGPLAAVVVKWEDVL